MDNKKPVKKALGRGLRALISSSSVPIQAPEGYKQFEGGDSGNAAVAMQVTEQSTQSEADYAPSYTSPYSTPPAAANTPELKAVNKDGVVYLDISNIANNPEQPRKRFNELELTELANSIAALGVIQPLVVREAPDQPGKYEIVAGERRWRASQIAGLTQVPVIIKDLGDRETLEIALVENIQRSNLTPIEEARAYQALMDEFNLSQKELSERVGKERSTITNYLRLLRLAPDILQMLEEGKLSMGHAKAILTVKEPSAQRSLAQKCVDEGLSVRQIEDIVSRVVVLDNKRPASKPNKKDFSNPGFFPEVMDRLRKTLGTKIIIQHDSRSGAGKLVIEYFSEAELDRVTDTICGGS